MKLADLGWDEAWAREFAPHRGQGLLPARVARDQEPRLLLWSEAGERTGEVAGRLKHQAAARAELPAVGDWVAVRPEPGVARIETVLPRRSRFSRKAAWQATDEQIVAANVDTLLVVSGLDGDFNLRRLERYLTLAWEGGAAPVLVLNKEDLCSDVAAAVLEAESIAFGAPVLAVSALQRRGLDAIRAHVAAGRTAAFVGSSGVGKSALVNALLEREEQAMGEVRRGDRRGRHTTTNREMFPVPGGGLVIDTPGLRELQLWARGGDPTPAFPEIVDAAAGCGFRDCTHEHEPRCAVQAALAAGEILPERFDSFLRLRAELRRLEQRQQEKKRRRR